MDNVTLINQWKCRWELVCNRSLSRRPMRHARHQTSTHSRVQKSREPVCFLAPPSSLILCKKCRFTSPPMRRLVYGDTTTLVPGRCRIPRSRPSFLRQSKSILCDKLSILQGLPSLFSLFSSLSCIPLIFINHASVNSFFGHCTASYKCCYSGWYS
jgi:hypothetical protein